ncbi:hypothetical protein CLV98_11625 [Dyadobacter jejuensis]|uniref:Uncharacterized protein n=1 Tax=Dyadobacter jejuensis TaxID=1082580 RepID=A0A316ABD3_9BACT|nr:hypothetical protein CLV98_11625 [Dyadobacter jejuensis]
MFDLLIYTQQLRPFFKRAHATVDAVGASVAIQYVCENEITYFTSACGSDVYKYKRNAIWLLFT